jgi:ATP-dependent helicase/nuclease subunit A
MNTKIKPIKSRIITANAGSGKTYTVIEHIKEIISAGYSPSSILCITFTRAGRHEMEKRLYDEKILGSEKPKIVTFHSLCLEIASMFTHELEIPLEFQTLETLPHTTVQAIIQELPNYKSVQEYIKKFKLIPSTFERHCKYIINNYQKLIDTTSRIHTIQDEIFQINFEEAETKKICLQMEILENIPLDILQGLSGKSIDGAMPTILEVYTQMQNGGGDINTLFQKYASAIKNIRNGGAMKEYKLQIEEMFDEINNIETFVQSYMLNNIVDDIIAVTKKHKRQNKEFTYNDLIHEALCVLKNPELRDFALFKFSHGLKHIIVDEAQDTNQDQWEIIDYIIEELKSENMEGGSLMIVGDNKQTIYGFQGSEEGMMEGIAQKYTFLRKEYLAKSYRTTQPVLDIINAMSETFSIDEHSKHISAFGKEVGSANIIASTQKMGKDETEQEYITIAEKLANIIQGLLQKNLQHEKEKYHGRKITPDDIAILVQNRPNETAINAIKNTFYQHKIPISFNEKINPHYSHAILDFIAILKLCVYSGDTLSLYGVLKSPIFNIDDQELTQKFAKDIENPYDYFPFAEQKIREFTEIFNKNGIRTLFQTLLNEYSSRYSQNEQQALELFIQSIQEQYNAIKFLQEFKTSENKLLNQKSGQGTVRLTTIHSSKGLEYPVVIFLDLKTKDQSNTDSIIIHKGTPIFKPSGKVKGRVLNEILNNQQSIEKAELMRLYYVAISRASEHFYYICNQKRTEAEDSLYKLLKQGLMQLNAEISHGEHFECISYSKSIETPLISHTPTPRIIVQYTPKILVKEVQTSEMSYGIFIHKLFENIENEEMLQEHLYAEYLNETINFQQNLAKVQRFNGKINETLQPIKIQREHEFIHNKEIIRLDAVYFLQNAIAIVDYKTQKPDLTKEIQAQITQYKTAAEVFYKTKVKCFIAWYNEEILEEI